MKRVNFEQLKQKSLPQFQQYVGEKVDFKFKKTIYKGVIPYFIGFNILQMPVVVLHKSRQMFHVDDWNSVSFKFSTHDRGKNFGE